MTRRLWILIAALLAACGLKVSVETQQKATIEVPPHKKRDDPDEDQEGP